MGSKYKKISIIFSVIVIIVIVAIVGLNIQKNNVKSSDDNVNQSSSSSKSQLETLTNALTSNKQTIWYLVNTGDQNQTTITRNSQIEYIFVVKKGYMTSYNVDNSNIDANISIDDVNKKSDTSIIKLAKSITKKTFNHAQEGALNDDGTDTDTDEDEDEDDNEPNADEQQDLSNFKKAVSAVKYAEMKSHKIKITAYNNGTNETPTREEIHYHAISYFYHDGARLELNNLVRDSDTSVSLSMPVDGTIDKIHYIGLAANTSYVFVKKTNIKDSAVSLDTKTTKLMSSNKQDPNNNW